MKAHLCLGEPNEPEKSPELEISPVLADKDSQPLQSNLTEPVAATARPVLAAVETAYAFIGNIKSPCSVYDIQNHITSKTALTTKISDIKKLDIKSDNLAFKVAVPKNKMNLLTSSSLWREGIRAEQFRPKDSKPNTNNRYKKTFRGPTPTSTRQIKPSDNPNWRRNQPSPKRTYAETCLPPRDEWVRNSPDVDRAYHYQDSYRSRYDY